MTDIYLTPIEKPRPRRWRFQFSLRTFLIVTVVVGGVASWFASTWWREETKLPGGMVLREHLRELTGYAQGGKTVPHGRFEALDKHGRTRATGWYDRGRPVGRWTIYHENGRQALAGRTADGERVGKWSAWNERGRRVLELSHTAKPPSTDQREAADTVEHDRQLRYVSDLYISKPEALRFSERSGPSRQWHASGKPKTGGPFAHDAREGQWTFWDEQGRKMTEGNYRAGVRHGVWTTYDDPEAPVQTWYLGGHAMPDIDEVEARLARESQSDDRRTRLDAILALSALGERGVPALQESLKSPDADTVRGALRSLARLGPDAKAALAELRRLAEGVEARLRFESLLALFAVDESSQAETFEQLLAQLDLDDSGTFAETGRRLAEFVPNHLSKLSAAMQSSDRDQRLRALAVAALAIEASSPPLWPGPHSPWIRDLIGQLETATNHADPETSDTAKEVLEVWNEELKRFRGSGPYWGGGAS